MAPVWLERTSTGLARSWVQSFGLPIARRPPGILFVNSERVFTNLAGALRHLLVVDLRVFGPWWGAWPIPWGQSDERGRGAGITTLECTTESANKNGLSRALARARFRARLPSALQTSIKRLQCV